MRRIIEEQGNFEERKGVGSFYRQDNRTFYR